VTRHWPWMGVRPMPTCWSRPAGCRSTGGGGKGLEDLDALLDAHPRRLVVGTSGYGRMRPAAGLERELAARGVTVEVLPTADAVERINELLRLGAAGWCTASKNIATTRRPGPGSSTADAKTRTVIMPQVPYGHQPQLKACAPSFEAVQAQAADTVRNSRRVGARSRACSLVLTVHVPAIVLLFPLR
jgi:hypothetical protein